MERKANGKEIAKSQSKYYKTYCSPSIKQKFKRLHEARYMLQEFKQERSRKQVIPGHRRRLQEALLPWWRRLHLYHRPGLQD